MIDPLRISKKKTFNKLYQKQSRLFTSPLFIFYLIFNDHLFLKPNLIHIYYDNNNNSYLIILIIIYNCQMPILNHHRRTRSGEMLVDVVIVQVKQINLKKLK